MHRRWLTVAFLAICGGMLGAVLSSILAGDPAGAASNPAVTVYQPASHRYFSPNGDGQDDTTTLYYCLTAASNVSITVTDQGGHAVRTIESGVSHPGSQPCFGWNNFAEWNGKSDAGAVVPDGVYTVTVHAVDAAGQVGDDTAQVGVDTRIPGGLTAPRPGDTLSGTANWRFAPTPGFAIGSVNVYCNGTPFSSSSVPGADGTFTGSGDTTGCVDGTNAVGATVSWTDPFGSSQSWTAPAVPVTVNNVPRLAVLQQSSRRSFSPNGDGQDDTTIVYYCLSKNATVTVTVADPGGSTVRTIGPSAVTGSNPCFGWNNFVEWDGKDGAGHVVPDRTYTVRVHAVDASGQSADDAVQVVVDTRAPGALTAPAANATVAGTVHWTFTPTPGFFPLTEVDVYCQGSFLGSATAPDADGTFTGSADSTACVAGANAVTAAVFWTDGFGVNRSWTAPPVPVTIGNPPRVTVYQQQSHRYFSPDGDGQDDSATVYYCLSANATETVTVVNAHGDTVRTYPSRAVTGTPVSCFGWNNAFTWDGRDDSGATVPDGVYTVRVHVVDAAGQTGNDSVEVGVDTRAPGTLTAPSSGATLSGTAAWRVAPAAGFPVTGVTVYCSGTFAGSSTAPGADGSFTGSVDTTGCRDGATTFTAYLGWTDPFGFSQSWSTSVPVTVNNTVRVSIYQPGSHRYFSPNGDGQEDTASVYYCLSRDATVTATVTGPGGSVVRTLPSVTTTGVTGCSGWTDRTEWDGRNDAGIVVADGVYTVRLHAVDGAGQSGDDTVQVGVDSRTPGSLIMPNSGDTLAGLAALAFQPTNGYPVSAITITVNTGGGASIFNPSPDGVWRTSLYAGTLQNGPAVLYTDVTSTDAFGINHVWQAPLTPVVVDASGLPLSVSATPSSGPAPLATTLHLTTSDPHAATVHYTVSFGDGSPGASGDVSAPYPIVDLPHTYVNPGAYRAVVTVTNGTGSATSQAVDVTATGAPNTAPVATLAIDHGSGVTPLPVQATITATDAENDALTYHLDFGDGGAAATGTLPQQPVTHTYTKAGTYLVRLTVSDGRLSTVKTATVVVGLPEPLAANAGDDQTATVNTAVHFDGSASRPAAGIESYHWSFGDGGTADGTLADHTYTSTGIYTATLTVTAGGQVQTDTAVVTVKPAAQDSGLTVSVKDSGAPVAGASLVVIDSSGQRFTAQSDAGGTGRFAALPDGSYTVYGWKDGYQPATATGTVTGGSGTATVSLSPGQVVEASLDSTPLTREQIIAAGINPDDPANQNVYQFSVDLAINSAPVTFTGYTASGGFPLCPTENGAPTSCGGGRSTFVSGEYTISVSVSYVHNSPELVWLVIPVKASWLKEFFDVRMVVTNLADPAFVLDHGSATLTLPTGLSLAPTATPQSRTTAVADIAGGHSATASWLVRGDTEGFYDLNAAYAGSLEPFGDTVTVDAATSKPLHVWGASAIQITIDAEQDIYDRYPYRVRVGLKNVADVPIYNAAVELLSQGRLHYLYQPREALRQGVAQIDPGTTFWTDDYILAPDITGTLDLGASFVEQVSGTGSPAVTIVSHAPLQTPATAPIVSAVALKNQVGLLWSQVPGATGYEIYETPDRSTDFSAVPVLTLPAGATSATVPVAPGASPWFAVSSIVNGRRTLVHPIVSGAAADHPTIPASHGRLSTPASCGADVGVSMQFSDPFFDLTGWAATVGAKAYPGGTLSGHSGAATFTVKASDIAAGGSLLTVAATDASGATGQAWSVWLSTACTSPIHMMVLGDSISWGQGLLDQDKYPELVQRWLEDTTSRQVIYDPVDDNLAHSGAVVNVSGDHCATDFRAVEATYDAGEVPLAAPDIAGCQVGRAKTRQADVILVDGCINDINPLNLIFNTGLDVKNAVQSKCGAPVSAMLNQLHKDHPQAQIVYTGYYRIIDQALSAVEIAQLVARMNLPQVVLSTLRGDLLQSRSDEFNKDFRDQANAVVNGLDPQHKWLKFADPSLLMQDGDGLFGAHPKLFGPQEAVLIDRDPMYESRALACFDAFFTFPLSYQVQCPDAAVGHPNVEGAKVYRDAVVAALTNWIPPPPPPAKVTGLTVAPLSLPKGDTHRLTVTATYDNGTTADAGALVTLSSDKPAVATIDTATTTVTAIGTGKARVTAVLIANPSITATAPVTVTAAVPRTLTVSPGAPLVAVGGKALQLTATVTMSDGTTKTPNKNLTWTPADPAIATVSAKGAVTGVGVGSTVVSVVYQDPNAPGVLTAMVTVQVVAGPPKITGFTPPAGPVGTQVTIEGTNLLGVTSITIGGVAATQFTVNSSTSITVVVPPGAQTGFIVVTTPVGTATSKTKFKVR